MDVRWKLVELMVDSLKSPKALERKAALGALSVLSSPTYSGDDKAILIAAQALDKIQVMLSEEDEEVKRYAFVVCSNISQGSVEAHFELFKYGILAQLTSATANTHLTEVTRAIATQAYEHIVVDLTIERKSDLVRLVSPYRDNTMAMYPCLAKQMLEIFGLISLDHSLVSQI